MSSTVTPPLGLGRPSQKNKKYRLKIIQNPIRARSCGFGEKDRRPIDPPPILQLFIERPDGTLQNAIEDDGDVSRSLVQCDLYSEDGKEHRGSVYNPSNAHNVSNDPSGGTLLSFEDPQPTRSLMGAVISNTYQLNDEHDRPGIFFVFQDLSVRIEGRFCLKFMFMNLAAGDPMTMSSDISDVIFSDVFVVYSAKNFPGMTDSTLLSQTFAQQGIKISIRKGRRIRRVLPNTSKRNDSQYCSTGGNLLRKKESNDDYDDEAPKPSYKRIEISSYLSTS
ncbi:hypothetical protein G6F46_000668 [Rhizopus delemar]|uniref:Velvet domain-containing protein n=2 Tax=Rhizopus TaxID=4842 RepID=A0A9P6ZDB6_9FUNG|nr:hypothetical protein G6F55_002031 [Rhizopus delemar]KAG1554091.1 hypothetical protein G6F51_000187 [Rhizopus arrhizus]KAG1496836.1 hypothetical protein G6F54_006192 [Rhizopus delemar]KAG1510909.1 hypothetical protein G6F53_006333 [Rhizopus delemar]KAG1519225.1 hypothetical protein G6F52_008828 [Rhizopus delemar]